MGIMRQRPLPSPVSVQTSFFVFLLALPYIQVYLTTSPLMDVYLPRSTSLSYISNSVLCACLTSRTNKNFLQIESLLHILQHLSKPGKNQ